MITSQKKSEITVKSSEIKVRGRKSQLSVEELIILDEINVILNLISQETGKMCISHMNKVPTMYGFERNSLWPSDAIWYCRIESTLDQIMAYHFFGEEPLPEETFDFLSTQILSTDFSGIQIKILVPNKTLSPENAFENVICKLSAIFSKPQCS